MYYETTAENAKSIFRKQIAEKKIPLTHEFAWEYALWSNDRDPKDVYREILREFGLSFRKPIAK